MCDSKTIGKHLKVAKQFSHVRIEKKTNMASIQLFYLLNASAICTIFTHNWTQCFDSFSL